MELARRMGRRVAASWRTLKSVDALGVVHVRELELLRAIPMFAPLAPPTIERLSANLVPLEVGAAPRSVTFDPDVRVLGTFQTR